MTKGVTYTTKNVTGWNEGHQGDIELDAFTRAYLNDVDITDRDRIAFALRELRRRGYNVYNVADRPVDWTKPQMICPLADSLAYAFGLPVKSRVYRRFERIATRNGLLEDDITFSQMLSELYNEALLYDEDYSDVLKEPYEFHFKGDPTLVEAVFQAVGLATRLGVTIRDDGSEAHHVITVARLGQRVARRQRRGR